MANQFEFETANGEKVFTGMQTPETMPLSFTAFPKPKIRSLDDIWELSQNPNLIAVNDPKDGLGSKVNQVAQGRRSSCNAYMVYWIMSILIWRATGKWVRLSPEYIYMLINGGKDGGSMLDDGMKSAFDGGCPIYNKAFYETYRQDQVPFDLFNWAKDNAKDQRFAECHAAPTESFEEMYLSMLSCIADGGAVGMAVHVGRNYMRSGETAGFDSGNGNHAVAGSGLKFKGARRPKSIEDVDILSPQTWKDSFAMKGFTHITHRHLYKPGKYHAMYCVNAVSANRSVVEDCRIK